MMAEYFIFFDIDFGDSGLAILNQKPDRFSSYLTRSCFSQPEGKTEAPTTILWKIWADRNRFIYTIKIIKWIKKYNIQEVCLYIIQRSLVDSLLKDLYGWE